MSVTKNSQLERESFSVLILSGKILISLANVGNKMLQNKINKVQKDKHFPECFKPLIIASWFMKNQLFINFGLHHHFCKSQCDCSTCHVLLSFFSICSE